MEGPRSDRRSCKGQLFDLKLVQNGEIEALEQGVEAKLAKAMEFAEASPEPDPERARDRRLRAARSTPRPTSKAEARAARAGPPGREGPGATCR